MPIDNKTIEDIRVRVIEEIKTNMTSNSQTQAPFNDLAIMIAETASKVCARMLVEYSKEISKNS